MTPLLAARRRPGADRSFERLYAKHVHAVYRYSLAVLHNEADAEDVTQTTFLNAYRAFQRGERPHTPHNWLIKIAHNVCRQRFRDSTRRPREVELNDSLTLATAEDADIPTATEIRRALGFLAFNQRAALVMRELEGRSYAEIAEVLDLSVGAVETLIFRARRALREQLEGGLTCREAELTLSRLEQRKLSSSERGALRAHLRECDDCALLERRQRGQRSALKHLGGVPLPASLASFFGGSGATGGVALGGLGIGTKVATVLAAGLVVTSVGHEPLTAPATPERVPAATHTAVHHETATPPATTRSWVSRRSHTRRATRKTAAKRFSGAAHSHARKLGTTKPTPVPGSAGGAGGTRSPVGGAPPPPPPLAPGVPVQPPPIHVPELPIQPPALPPPIQLPPPPIELPPIQLPPPPPLP